MMYLSQLKLLKSRESAAAIARFHLSKYSEHQVLWELAGAGDNSKRDFLYRADTTPEGITVLVLSTKPFSAVKSPWLENSKPYDPAFAAGHLLQFKLRVSPTFDKAMPGKRSERQDLVIAKYLELEGNSPISIVAPAAAEQWLRSREENSGFRLVESTASNYQRLTLLEKEQEYKIPSIDIEGILEVTDPTLFKAKQATGYGKSRYAGMGLMLVKALG